jgi:outer membrane protein TolC
VTYEVIDNYIIAGQALNRVQALRERQALYDRQVTGRTGLEQAGLDDDIESASLRSERSLIGADMALESARYAEAVANLSLLTGTVVNDVKTVRFPKGVAGTERRIAVADAVRQGQENNPAIMSAALSVVGADLDRMRAKASEYMPVIDAYATLEREDRADSRFGGGSLTQDTAIGLSLTVPIFNADGRGYPSREKASELRASTMGYYARRRSVESEIRSTHARMGDLNRAVEQSAAAAKDARKALEGERNLLTSGQSVDLAVAARELRLNKAQEQVAYFQAEYLRAWARLHYLMGAEMTNIEL